MSFDKDVERFAKRARGGAGQLTRKVELSLFSAAITSTPVDLGRLKGNWIYSSERPTLEPKPEDHVDPDGGATIQEMISGVNRAEWPRKSYLINNLPYAIPIEEGHGGRQPGVMVRLNVRRVVRAFARFVREVR